MSTKLRLCVQLLTAIVVVCFVVYVYLHVHRPTHVGIPIIGTLLKTAPHTAAAERRIIDVKTVLNVFLVFR